MGILDIVHLGTGIRLRRVPNSTTRGAATVGTSRGVSSALASLRSLRSRSLSVARLPSFVACLLLFRERDCVRSGVVPAADREPSASGPPMAVSSKMSLLPALEALHAAPFRRRLRSTSHVQLNSVGPPRALLFPKISPGWRACHGPVADPGSSASCAVLPRPQASNSPVSPHSLRTQRIYHSRNLSRHFAAGLAPQIVRL